MTDFKVTWAHALSAATIAAGYLVAFVPSLAAKQQYLIVGGAVVLSAVILLAHAIRTQPTQPVPAVASDAVQRLVQEQFNRLVADLPTPAPAPAPVVAPAPVAAPAPAPQPPPAA